MDKIKIACVGDSITELSGYPEIAQQILGINYIIGNFGASGTTVSFNSEYPYMYQEAFVEAKRFQPNIAVVMLGTNDANIAFEDFQTDFINDYLTLLSSIRALKCNPKVLVAKPPHIFDEIWLSGKVFDKKIIPSIEKVADKYGLPIIDVYSAMSKPEFFFDGVHPNGDGARIIANVLCDAIIRH
jgi:lysophospholipase L1-like esterase